MNKQASKTEVIISAKDIANIEAAKSLSYAELKKVYDLKKPKAKEATAKTLTRREANKDAKVRINNFATVVKDYKTNTICLGSNVTIGKINKNLETVKKSVLSFTSDSQDKRIRESKKITFHWERLAKLLTDYKFLKIGMTKGTIENFDSKAFTPSNINDYVYNCIKMNAKTYNAKFEQIKGQK